MRSQYEVLDFLTSRVIFLMGKKQRVRFWNEKWYGDEPLYTILFAIVVLKEAWIVDVWNPSVEGGYRGQQFSIVLSY